MSVLPHAATAEVITVTIAVSPFANQLANAAIQATTNYAVLMALQLKPETLKCVC